jgi:oxaloacetate decarboxylase beta subunit
VDFKKNKQASCLSKSWWVTFIAIIAVLFCLGVATQSGAQPSSEISLKKSSQTEDGKQGTIELLFDKTGVKGFVEGFWQLGWSENERNAYKAEKAHELAVSNAEAFERLKAKEEIEKHKKALLPNGIGQILMILAGLLLIYLAIAKKFEPLLLLPIGFGGILANIPVADIAFPSSIIGHPDGFLYIIYSMGIENGLFPLLIFMGVGAMTDFGPLLADPKTALLGAAAQFGIFSTLLIALWLSGVTEAINFSLQDAAAIAIIGGADGPTSIFVAGRLAPSLLGAIAVAAYSYMALVPIIQPPIMKLLTTKKERMIDMEQLRHVGKLEKICFPLIVLFLCILLLPDATPLIGSLMFGNLVRECGVVERLSNTIQHELINIVTIFLVLAVGSKLSAETFLSANTLGILILGAVAFSIGTASGVLLAKLMNLLSKKPINPLIGAAGVSAVPMAARVVNKVGLDNNAHNFLLMHAMGPNVSGVIGSAVAAGVLLALVG